MSIKIEIKGNYLFLTDTVGGKVDKGGKGSSTYKKNSTGDYSFINKTGSDELAIFTEDSIAFADIVDSSGSPFASVSAFETFLNENTGFNPTTGGSVVTLNNEIIINSESDFTNQTATTITPENNKTYRFPAGAFFLSKNFDFSSITGSVEFDCNQTFFLYSGTGTLMTGTPTGALVMNDGVFFGDGTTKVFDLTGTLSSPTSIIRTRNLGFANFTGSGMLKDIFGINIELFMSETGTGLQIQNSVNLNMSNVTLLNSVDSSSPKISISGSYSTVSIKDTIPIVQANESFIQMSPDVVVNSLSVTGTTFDDSLGGEFLASAKVGSITAYADNGSGGTTVTSTAHGLTIEQKIAQTGSTSYNGTHDLFNVTTNTYDINVVFVSDDATGTFTTGNSNDLLDKNGFMFVNNGDQLDTNCVGSSSMIVPYVEAISGVGVPVMVDTVDWVIGKDRRFELVSSELNYTGAITIPVRVIGLITMDSTGGIDDMVAYMAVNGVVIPESKVIATTGTPKSLAPSAMIDINPNDDISMFIANENDTSDINVTIASMQVHKI